MSAGHRTGTGLVPEVRAVSWSCTCGHGEVLQYGPKVTGDWALLVAQGRADTHRTFAFFTNGSAS